MRAHDGPELRERAVQPALDELGLDAGSGSRTAALRAEAPDGSGTLFAGTETAAYRRDKGADQAWVDITDAAAPVTTYWSAEALRHENTIRFGTYGRGIWDYQLDPDGTGCFPPVDRDGGNFRGPLLPQPALSLCPRLSLRLCRCASNSQENWTCLPASLAACPGGLPWLLGLQALLGLLGARL